MSIFRSNRGPAQELLVFASLFLAFLIVFPTILTMAFPFYRFIQVADVVDLLTPFVLLAAYFRLQPKVSWPFFIFAVCWIEGHGLHLASNSIGNVLSEKSGTVYRLTDFYDEHLSHYLWMLGVLGLWGTTYFRARANGALKSKDRVTVWAAAVLYGCSYFMIAVEGQTTPLAIPAAAAFVVVALNRRQRDPITFFTFLSHALSLALFLAWAIYWRGLPEFSAVGII